MDIFSPSKLWQTPAFGRISLSDASGATFRRLQGPVEAPTAPIWETAAFGGGERNGLNNNKKIKIVTPRARHIWGTAGAPVGSAP